MLWGSNPLEVYRMRVSDQPEVTARMSAGGGLEDVFGGAYTLLDKDGRFYTTNTTRIQVYEADGPDGIAAVGTFSLPEPEPGELLRGLGMTYDGVLICASSAGRVLAIDRGTLQAVSELQLGGEVSNAMAIDEEGGIFVVTSEAMYRVQWTGEKLSSDPAEGAWRAEYETGSTDVAGGRLGAGSGSTPSLMTVGEDKLVVITDGQPLMHLVAFWRDAIPDGWQALEGADVQIAAQVPVTFGDPMAATSLSEQSVLVMGDGAVVVNNDYGEHTSGFLPIIDGVAPLGIEKFVWDPEANVLATAWVVDDISCPNGIPTASSATGQMYCVGKRGDTWTVEAIDWETGVPSFHVETGVGSEYNSVYAATEVGPDRAIWTGTMVGSPGVV